jgi:hypothetical protein
LEIVITTTKTIMVSVCSSTPTMSAKTAIAGATTLGLVMMSSSMSVEGFAFIVGPSASTTRTRPVQQRQYYLSSSSSSSALASTVEDDAVSSGYQDLVFLSSLDVTLSSSSSSSTVDQVEMNWHTLAEFASPLSSSYRADDSHNDSTIIPMKSIESILLTSDDNDVVVTAAEETSPVATPSLSSSPPLVDVLKVTDDDVQMNAFGFLSSSLSTTKSTSASSGSTNNSEELQKTKHIQYPGYRDIMFECSGNSSFKSSTPIRSQPEKKKEGRYLSSIEAAELFMDMFYTQGTKVVPLDAESSNGSANIEGIIIADDDSSMSTFQ